MKFSFLSWNVRQYKGSEARLLDADNLITGLDPDVFGLIEFRAKKQMRKLMFNSFPEYDFAVTDSKMGLEVIVGWKRNKFKQAIWTQKREFRSKNINLRPGGLISLNLNNHFYNLLFLHTDSGADKDSYKNRRSMFNKIWKLSAALKKASPHNRSNLIALGDLNTMGNGASISGKKEIAKLDKRARKKGMRILSKDAQNTWHQWGKSLRRKPRKLKVSELGVAMKSDLDHVIASNDLQFASINANNDKIQVEGWNQLNGVKRVNYLWALSDHSALYGEVS